MTSVVTLSQSWTLKVDLMNEESLQKLTRATNEIVSDIAYTATTDSLTLFAMSPVSVTPLGRVENSVVFLVSVNALAWRHNSGRVTEEEAAGSEQRNEEAKAPPEFPAEIDTLIGDSVRKGYKVEYQEGPQ